MISGITFPYRYFEASVTVCHVFTIYSPRATVKFYLLLKTKRLKMASLNQVFPAPAIILNFDMEFANPLHHKQERDLHSAKSKETED
jgi:hypothetical protein